MHQSRLVKSYQSVLKKVGVVFFYLPPYSPELNLIEAAWQVSGFTLPQF
jgi:transposase